MKSLEDRCQQVAEQLGNTADRSRELFGPSAAATPARPTAVESTTFIQWKGTDLCMDFWCPECGRHSHFDGLNAYNIRCDGCDSYYVMPTDIAVTKLPGKPDGMVLEREPDSLVLNNAVYDPAKDAHDSYYAAIEAKRLRGDAGPLK